jgi:hypothetical protein
MFDFTSGVRRFFGSTAIASILCMTGLQADTSTLATTVQEAPILLAQRQNVRIATLQCGPYRITIRTVGSAASERYSYQTKGLYLTNGTRNGETYSFYNNDHEYRVLTRGGGSGRLSVFHYGRRILDRQCTWS